MQATEATLASAVREEPDFLPALNSLLKSLQEYSGAIAGTVRLRDPLRQELRLVAAVGVPPGLWQYKRRVYAGCGVCGIALTHDEARIEAIRCGCSEEIAPACEGGHLHLLTIPLRDHQGPCGVLNLFFPLTVAIAPQLPGLLSAFSELIGMTLSNSRRREEQLRTLLQEERRILANEVHDALAQNITYMRLRAPLLRDAIANNEMASAGGYLRDVESSLEVAHQRVRELITHFRSEMPPQGLLTALRQTLDELQGINGVALSMEVNMNEPMLDMEQSLQILHIGREALANVVKHSRAQHGWLRLEAARGQCHLSVEDDGIGIGADQRLNHGHFGLNIMRERAHLLDGEFVIEPRDGGGTRVRLSFPYDDECDDRKRPAVTK